MRLARLLLGLVLTASAGQLRAQAIFRITPEGVEAGDFEARSLARPVKPSDALETLSIPAQQAPRRFFLANPVTGQRFGPYDLAAEAPVGSQTIAACDSASGTFTLRAPDGPASGPFAATNDAPVQIGTNQPALRFSLADPALEIRCMPANPAPVRGFVGLAPLTPELVEALYALRAGLTDIANRLRVEQAPLVFDDVPTIKWNRRDAAGNIVASGRTDNTLTPSTADRRAASQRAERSAAIQIARFAEQWCPLRPAGAAPLYRGDLPAGDYLLLVWQKVKDPEANGPAPFLTLFWLTPVRIAPFTQTRLDLDDTNAGTWADLFRFN